MKSHRGYARGRGLRDEPESVDGSWLVFGGLGLALWLAILLTNAPWAGFHGILFALVGGLMLVRPGGVPLVRGGWLLAGLFWVAGCAAFLPAGVVEQPSWRSHLESLGLATGGLVVIQWRQALESYAVLALIPLGALWLVGHRAGSSQVRFLATAFVCAVAAYAVIAKFAQPDSTQLVPAGEARFGFLPNRNHTACYLAMGVVCGLGCVVQALRDRRWPMLALALAALGVCVWAIFAWSVSRAGVVLTATGCALWLPLMGWQRLGRHGRWTVGLLVIAMTGGFLLTDSVVKQRLAATLADPTEEPAATPGQEKSVVETVIEREFRVDTALDTADLIREFPWTGVGAGQFRVIYPQFRTRTAAVNNSDQVHPESDWLWLAAECGVPAAAALLAWVLLGFGKAGQSVKRGRERALRAACLAAAALVPLHGLFDVPGHRIALAWTAAWLFALALQPPSAALAPGSLRPRWRRLAALPMMAAACWMIWAQWGRETGAFSQSATITLSRINRLVSSDAAAREAAQARGLTYDPPATEDPLVRGLELLAEAVKIAPMERSLHRNQGILALHFDDRDDLVRSAFAIERALDPSWVGCALEQARLWAMASPAETEELWDEAMRRAEHLDRVAPGTAWSAGHTWGRIKAMAATHPDLQPRWTAWASRHPLPPK